MATNITRDELLSIIRELIGGRYFQGSGGGQAMSGQQLGQNIGGMVAPFITGNPMFQRLIGNIGGNALGNVINANFPGTNFGMNINDSYLRQEMSKARKEVMDYARSDIRAGFETARGDKNKFLYGMAANFAGVHQLGANIDPSQFGYVAMPFGDKSAFITDEQIKRNKELRKKLYSSGDNKGFYRTITEKFASNPYEFGGMTGGDVGTLTSDMASRGLLRDMGGKSGDDFKGTVAKIKKAAQSVKSIRDIIKGPLNEVMRQMDQTFGSGYLNTFGPAGAATMVNKMRAAANMGGFSTQQIMGMAPAIRSMVKAVGGSGVNAGDATTMTAVLMGMTRGGDKRFVDEGALTKEMMMVTTGAQESRMGKNIASARSFIRGDKAKADFDKEIRGLINNNKDVTMEFLAKKAGTSVGTIVSNRDSLLTKEEMNKSDIGMQAMLAAQKKEVTGTRSAIFRQELGEDLYNKLGGKDILFSNLEDLRKSGKISKSQYANLSSMMDWQAKSRGFRNNNHMNLTYGKLEEGIQMKEKAREMGELFTNSNFGSTLGVNALAALNGKKDKDGNTLGIKKLVGMLITQDDINDPGKRKGVLANAGNRKQVEGFIKKLAMDAKKLGLSEEEQARYIDDHVKRVSMYKGGIEGYLAQTKGYDGSKMHESAYVQAYRRKEKDLSRFLSGEDFDKAVSKEEKEIADKLGKDPKDLTQVEKNEAKRKVQKSKIEKHLEMQINALSDKDPQKMRLNKVLNKIKKADAADLDDVLKENKAVLKDAYTDKVAGMVGESENTAMTKLSDIVVDMLPKLLDAIKGLAAVFAGDNPLKLDILSTLFGGKTEKNTVKN